jgi:hypothetical protein
MEVGGRAERRGAAAFGGTNAHEIPEANQYPSIKATKLLNFLVA